MTFIALKEKKAAAAPESMCPPWCRRWCSMFLGVFLSPLTVGIVLTMAGIFNIGLGPGRISTHPYDVADLGAAYWLGGVYLATGIITLAMTCISRFYFLFAVIMNVISSLVSIAGIVLYAMDLENTSVVSMCDRSVDRSEDNCYYVAYVAQRLLTGMDGTLIVVTVIQLLISVPFVVYFLYHICCRSNKDGAADAEVYQPVLQEVLMTRPGA